MVKSDSPFTISLDAFNGPLDLMLHLIHQHKLDLLDLDLSELASQYLDYVQKQMSLDDASEYMVEFARLLEYKSSLLLPVPNQQEYEETLKNEYSSRLMEYQQVKEQAALFKERIQEYQNTLARNPDPFYEELLGQVEIHLAPIALKQLVTSYKRALERMKVPAIEVLPFKELDIAQRMEWLLAQAQPGRDVEFDHLYRQCSSRLEIIVTFLAVLEAIRDGYIGFIQGRWRYA